MMTGQTFTAHPKACTGNWAQAADIPEILGQAQVPGAA